MIHFQVLVPVLKQTATRFATNLLSFDSVFFYYFNHCSLLSPLVSVGLVCKVSNKHRAQNKHTHDICPVPG